jgi:hypothetical protein
VHLDLYDRQYIATLTLKVSCNSDICSSLIHNAKPLLLLHDPNSTGVVKNEEEAVRLYKQAILEGHDTAQRSLDALVQRMSAAPKIVEIPGLPRGLIRTSPVSCK